MVNTVPPRRNRRPLGIGRCARKPGRFSIYTTQAALWFQKSIFETIRGRVESEGWNRNSAGRDESAGKAKQQNATRSLNLYDT
jgi:hypothetical protein